MFEPLAVAHDGPARRRGQGGRHADGRM